MSPILTVDQIRLIESYAEENGYSTRFLFDRVAEVVALRLIQIIGKEQDYAKITFLVGTGNNGMDAIVSALLLKSLKPSWQLSLYLVKPIDTEQVIYNDLSTSGIFMVVSEEDQHHRVLQNLIATSQVVVDALLGIGTRLPLQGQIVEILKVTQQSLRRVSQETILEVTGDSPIKAETRPYVIAIDLPSGIQADSGEVDRHTLTCDESLVLIAMKKGLISKEAQAVSGLITLATLGLPSHFFKQVQPNIEMVTIKDLAFPIRKQDGHKGTFGKALIIGGSTNYVGAVGLSATSAYRTGVGLVTVASSGNVVEMLAGDLLEPTWIVLPNLVGSIASNAYTVLMPELTKYDAILIGPGLGKELQTKEFLISFLTQKVASNQNKEKRSLGFVSKLKHTSPASAEQAIRQPQWVIDADGLNLLSQIEEWFSFLPPDTILTPHPGEMARLCNTSIEAVQSNRITLAQEKAQEWNCILLLKGAHTIIASPDGNTYLLPFKTDALATAGSGDVLAGMIVSLLAQGLSPLQATLCGGYLHGMCGHVATRQQGSARAVIARDLIAAIGASYEKLGLT